MVAHAGRFAVFIRNIESLRLLTAAEASTELWSLDRDRFHDVAVQALSLVGRLLPATSLLASRL
jgi:hypothetical protein